MLNNPHRVAQVRDAVGRSGVEQSPSRGVTMKRSADETLEPTPSPTEPLLTSAVPEPTPTDLATVAPPPPLTKDPKVRTLTVHADDDLPQKIVEGLFEVEDALLIKQAASTNALRGCFASLVRHDSKSLKRFQKLLATVTNYLPAMAHKYPYVVFHEGDADPLKIAKELLKAAFPPDQSIRWPSTTKGSLPWLKLLSKFVYPAGIRFAPLTQEDFGKIPDWIVPENVRPWFYSAHNYWGINYRHMCRFFGVILPYHNALHDFDYYLRLDTDSYILTRPYRLKPRYLTEAQKALSLYGIGNNVAHVRIREAHLLTFRHSAGTMLDPFNESQQYELKPHRGKGHAVTTDDSQSQQSQNGSGGVEADDDDIVDADLFMDFVASPPPSGRGVNYMSRFQLFDRHYGFVMLHPQEQPIFLHDLWETFDSFLLAENNQKSGDELLQPKSMFKSPRGSMVHYWDNFEILDLRVFRSAKHREWHPIVDQDADPEGKPHEVYDKHVQNEKRTYERYRGEIMKRVYDALALANPDKASQWEKETELKRANARLKELMAAADDLHDLRRTYIHRFTEFFDRRGGFYYARWGDAEVRTLTASLFFKPEEIAYFHSLPYQHYHNYHCPGVATAPTLFDESAEERTKRLRLVRQIEARCLDVAKRNFGEGNKGTGTAAMNPAERDTWNEMFKEHVAEEDGWHYL